MTGIADITAQTLYAHGVRHAFGCPGAKALDRGSETIAVRERLGGLFRPPSGWGPHHEFDVVQSVCRTTLDHGRQRRASYSDQQVTQDPPSLQDESLALIELKQAQAGLERRGVRLGKTKFEDIAPAFGGEAGGLQRDKHSKPPSPPL
jgi:hypothetical protein